MKLSYFQIWQISQEALASALLLLNLFKQKVETLRMDLQDTHTQHPVCEMKDTSQSSSVLSDEVTHLF